MNHDFMIRALIAGLGFAWIAGPMGCLVVWRRMSFFGDTLAHASLCGIALSFLFDYPPFLGILLVSFLIACLLAYAKVNFKFSADTLLAVASHSALSGGILGISLIKGTQIDLNAYLFGDLLSVTSMDIWIILGGGLIICVCLSKIWSSMLTLIIAEDLAAIEGIPVARINVFFMLLLALFIAVSIKIVGILLVTGLLILPALTAQSFSKSPEQMALFSIKIGSLMVMGGLTVSNYFDVPIAPAIVLIGFNLFIISCLFQRFKS